ncbi:hypothetical protein TNCT_130151 [Trichonephila clavata]|uniref:Uncharacterized protein n=1 Tax=Trichonephila clavata TaxID=2740835 RepID=A0A8X6G8C1_TRICU|nr:hypothetical protein TNCT_130151 [Trichonephila clavata]
MKNTLPLKRDSPTEGKMVKKEFQKNERKIPLACSLDVSKEELQPQNDFYERELEVGLDGLVKRKSPSPDAVPQTFDKKKHLTKTYKLIRREGFPNTGRKIRGDPNIKAPKDLQY